MSTTHPATAGDVAAIADAAGAHVAPLLAAVEARLIELANAGGPQLGPHAEGTIRAGGKRLRPLLVIVCAGEVAGDEEVAAVVRAAVAVELVHAATLVHDDVLDGAQLRRGRPTVAASAGREIARATGDLLFARAFTELVANRSAAQVQVLSAASSALARGELLQRHDAWDATVSIDRYLERCELKTAGLFEAACALGALAAGDGHGTGGALAAFGRRIGLAFQILDDVLDVTGPAERTGKDPGADLLDGTITLPFILARARDPQLAARAPESISSRDDAADVCAAIAATGALDAARDEALRIVAAAKAELPAELADRQRRALELVADVVVARYA